MTKSSDHHRSAADRTLALRARADLAVVETALGGQASYVVKDPVSGEAFHFSAEEHALFDALRRPRSLRELARLIETKFPPRTASIPQLQQFVTQLHEQGLLVSDNRGQGEELLKRGRDRIRRRRWSSLTQVLAIRVGGFNAGPWVDRLYSLMRWACSPWALAAAGILVAHAAIVAIGNAPELAARLPALKQLARPALLPMWLAAITCVKVCHELGHALVCRHFGARPQEAGVLLLAGAPALYCDVTDAWRLPSKWQRMAVSSAGMGVELVIAAAAAIVWRFAAPGIVSTLALSLIVVCSVHTLLVNINPLLRYDGYYLLADWLEVPNLAERARGLVTSAWKKWLLGERMVDDSLVGPHKRRALWAYALLAKAYLTLVLVGVVVVLVKLARPYALENVVYTLAVFALAGLVVRPILAIGKLLANPSVRARFRWLRLILSLMFLVGMAVGVLAIPMTRHIAGPMVVVPAKSHPLFAVTAGELRFAAPAGSQVQAGDVVVRLANPDMELALVAAEGMVRERQARLDQLRTMQAAIPAASRLVPTAEAELADAQAQLREQQAMVDRLVVRAPAAGRVLPPPARVAERKTADLLPVWRGSPLEQQNIGAWIEVGAPLCVVAEPGGWTAWAGVDEADAPAVQPGDAVRLLTEEQPMSILAGRVVQVAQRARENASDARLPSHRSGQAVGDERYHVVEIAFDAADALVLPSARGTAKITAERSTLGGLVALQLRRAFQRAF